MSEIYNRFLKIRDAISRACNQAGRNPAEIRILAASKTHNPETIGEAMAAGIRLFGENRVQEAAQKIPLCPAGAEWHLIGHLQSNKCRHAVNLFSCIHSVDSLDLAQHLEREAAKAGRQLDCLVEANVAGERQKFGIAPNAAADLVKTLNAASHLTVVGLMTVPPFAVEAEIVRPYFRSLRELRHKIEFETGVALPELSMGMSGDYAVAVEEGATIVRIGTALFGERKSTIRKTVGESE